MTWTTLPANNVLAVNPSTGRYVSGDDGNVLRVFNADDTLYDTQAMPGSAWGASVDPLSGRFFVTTQSENQLVVYSEGSRAVIARQTLDEPGSSSTPFTPVFDPSSGKIFVNRYFSSGQELGSYRALVFDKSYARAGVLEGSALAADGAGTLYVSANHFDTGGTSGISSQNGAGGTSGRGTAGPSRLETRDSATLSLSGAQIDTDAYWVGPDLSLGRLYVKQLEDIAVFDRATGNLVARPPLGERLRDAIAFAPGDDRIYVTAFDLGAGQDSTQRVLVFGTH